MSSSHVLAGIMLHAMAGMQTYRCRQLPDDSNRCTKLAETATEAGAAGMLESSTCFTTVRTVATTQLQAQRMNASCAGAASMHSKP
jgi:hypothetical protein